LVEPVVKARPVTITTTSFYLINFFSTSRFSLAAIRRFVSSNFGMQTGVIPHIIDMRLYTFMQGVKAYTGLHDRCLDRSFEVFPDTGDEIIALPSTSWRTFTADWAAAWVMSSSGFYHVRYCIS
jgi:hypothetical protein